MPIRIAQTGLSIAILVTFALIPVWYRLPTALFGSSLYIARFAILLPALLAIGLWLVSGLPGLRGLRQSRPGAHWALLLLALALWMVSSGVWAFMRARQPDLTVNAGVSFGTAALFAIVVACRASPGTVVRALAIALLFNSALVIAQALNQSDLGLRALGEFLFSPETRGASVVVSGAWRYVRPYGLLPHPNIAAGALLIGLCAAAALLFDPRRAWRATGLIGIGVGSAALLLTFSRAAWVGAAVSGIAFLLAAYPLLRDRRSRRMLAITAGIVMIVGAIFVISYRPLIAARTGSGEESIELRSVADRLVFTDFALRMIGEQPVLGVGAGNFPWRSAFYLRQTFYDLLGDNVHLVYLLAAAETGLVGVGLLIGALAAGVWGAVRAIRGSQDGERAARGALLAGALALAVVGLFDHYPHTILHMQIAWWGMIGAAIAPGYGSRSATGHDAIAAPSSVSAIVPSAG